MHFDDCHPRLGSVASKWFVFIVLALAVWPVQARQAAGMARLSWLQGCWAISTSGREVEEYWMAPKGTSMLGVGRTLRDGVLVDYEMMVIRQTSRIVFENPQHDFPQRIGYERSGNRLLAWIEGTQGGRSRKVEFPYVRAACAGD